MDGWVSGAELVFKSKTSPDDYHDEMNSEHYMVHCLMYLTNEATQLHGRNITALRLPVAHCELNPIDLAWAWVKQYVAEQNQRNLH